MLQDQADAIGIAAGKTATYGGGVSAFVFGLSANEVAALGGLVVAIIGLCVQVYYNRRKDHRAVELHELRKARLIAGEDEDE